MPWGSHRMPQLGYSQGMKRACHFALLASAMLSLAQPASAQLTASEPPDLANSAPGTTYSLTNGVNTVSGAVSTPSDIQDHFRVTVPPGATLNSVSVVLNTSGGFVGGAIWDLSNVRNSSGSFGGVPVGAGTYPVMIYTDFSIGNSWTMTFNVTGATPVCGNGVREGSEACDDGNTTQCDGCSNTCATVINGCFIGGACVVEGTIDATNACRACQRTVSRTAYSARPTGTACDDGQFCTAVDTCDAAARCGGTARNCADALTCTTDTCNETTNACVNALSGGCIIGSACIAAGTASPTNPCLACNPAASTTAYTPRAAGSACDDGSFCTTGDACDAAGACGGAARDCGDTLTCTTDACDEAADACTNVVSTGCLVSGVCIAEGESEATNGCMVCTPATSTTAFSPAASGLTCDDGTFCTDSDACDGSGVCTGEARVCMDDDACTTDACDETTAACTFEMIAGCMPDSGAADAGAADAGVDAGAGRADVGAVDASATSDVGEGIDAGTIGGMTGGSCGCRVAGGTNSTRALTILATLALGLVARRRRAR